MKEIVNDLKVMAFAYRIANLYDAVPMEDEYIDMVRKDYPGEPMLETVLGKYAGCSYSDMTSAIIYYIDELAISPKLE